MMTEIDPVTALRGLTVWWETQSPWLALWTFPIPAKFIIGYVGVCCLSLQSLSLFLTQENEKW